MERFKRTVASVLEIVHIVADWFLILSGVVLILWSLLSVDVAEARYLLVTCGIVLSTAGGWFRHLARKRKSGTL